MKLHVYWYSILIRAYTFDGVCSVCPSSDLLGCTKKNTTVVVGRPSTKNMGSETHNGHSFQIYSLHHVHYWIICHLFLVEFKPPSVVFCWNPPWFSWILMVILQHLLDFPGIPRGSSLFPCHFPCLFASFSNHHRVAPLLAGFPVACRQWIAG